ncbi:hypothetical protein PTKIN_Ptkin04bG0090200 [Pterospermum kingtungense]
MDFNVSQNSLQGPIPQTHILQCFPESSYQHNLGLCGNPLKKQCPVSPTPSIPPTLLPLPQGSSKKHFEARDIAFIVAVSVLVPILVIFVFLWVLAEVLGKGKLSTTSKAMLELGLVITVKRVKGPNGLSKKEFIQQMQFLGKLRHENLAQIISFYNSKEEKLIIYEFAPNGNLFELLQGQI